MTRLLLVGVLLVGSACGSEDDNRPPTLEYVTEAILQPSCALAECHSTFTQEVGDVFDTVASARRTMVAQAMVTYSVTPTDSYLVQTITVGSRSVTDTDDTTLIRMPYDAPIHDYDVDLIKKWIASGTPGGNGPVGAQCVPAPNDDSTSGCNTLGQIVDCDDGTAGAVITDCTKLSPPQSCSEGVCAP